MTKGKRKYAYVDLPQLSVEVIDPRTGEVRKEVPRIRIPVYKDQDFCKVYYKGLYKITDLPKSCQKVFDYCLENMDSENKVLILNQRRLADELGLKLQTIRNAISRLLKQGFLKRIENGLYQVNPVIACKVTNPSGIFIDFVDSEDFEQFVENATGDKK
jgi:hypothetical protein